MGTQRTAGAACLLMVMLATTSLTWGQSTPETPTPAPGAATPAPEAAPADATTEKPTAVPESSPPPAGAPAAKDDESDRGNAPISADDILKEFQRERPVAEPLLPRPRMGETVVRETAAGDMAAGNSGRLPDGHILVDRACRMVRDGDWWVLTFVADNHPQTAPEPPMKLLPNRMLERMVRESEGVADGVEFIVSGEVTDFMGENYLLLRKLMRKRDLGNLTR